jgi:hypothetical protein
MIPGAGTGRKERNSQHQNGCGAPLPRAQDAELVAVRVGHDHRAGFAPTLLALALLALAGWPGDVWHYAARVPARTMGFTYRLSVRRTHGYPAP